LERGQVRRGLWGQRSLKVQGSNNRFRLSVPELEHPAEFCPGLGKENNLLFLIETFITLSRVYEASKWEAS
jgi:hypothetical protein